MSTVILKGGHLYFIFMYASYKIYKHNYCYHHAYRRTTIYKIQHL